MDVKKAILKKVAYPIVLRSKGWQEVLTYSRFLKEREFQPYEHNKKFQNKRLFQLVQHAIKTVPYYRNLAKQKNIQISEKTIETDLKQFPILTKQAIRDNLESLRSERCNAKQVYENTSGGSTGEPVRILQDRQYQIQNATLFPERMAGYEFGDKLIKLWGSERDILEGGMGLRAKVLNYFYRRTRMLNSFQMTEEDMFAYVQKINRFQPKLMVCYVQSIYELALFIERKGISVFSPNAIQVSAGTLYPDFRKKIEQVFQCKVWNHYGSREVGAIATECEKQKGLHIHLFHQYVEILDEADREVEKGIEGRIVITNLTNYTMPLLRFAIGDIGSLSPTFCSCGRGLPCLQAVTGRTVNVFTTKEGKKVDGEYFTHLFYELKFVRKFQVVQTDYEEIQVKMELFRKEDFQEKKEVFQDMSKKIRLVMGKNCKIRYRCEKEIKPSPSGKFIYTISEIDRV